MNIPQELITKPELTERIRGALRAWLDSDPSDFSRLVEWLEGYSLPGVSGDESYLLLLQGLRGIERRLDEAFTLRLAAFLESEPDVSRPGERPDEVLYNLLRLCAGFSRPLHFAQPLQAMLKRRQISGNFEGTDLRAVLRDALIANQKDSSLLRVWESLSRTENSGYLPGDVRDALEGVASMPSSGDSLDKPDFKAIGCVLGRFAGYLGEKEQRKDIFSAWLKRLAARWGTSLWYEFAKMADQYGWPEWTRELLKFDYVDPPPKVPKCGPSIGVLAEVQRRMSTASAADRDEYEQLWREINDIFISVFRSVEYDSVEEKYSEEHYRIVQLENDYSDRGQEDVAEAIRVGRSKYVIEKGIIGKCR